MIKRLLFRLAYAITKNHIHRCRQDILDPTHEGTCVCVCGAVLVEGPRYDEDGNWWWYLPDGGWAKFPDFRLRDDYKLPRLDWPNDYQD